MSSEAKRSFASFRETLNLVR